MKSSPAIREAWLHGNLSYKLRRHGQTRLYNWIKRWQKDHPNDPGPLLCNCHRRFGKSFNADLIAAEYAKENPRQTIRIYAPTKAQAIDIGDDQWSTILEDCPEEINFKMEAGDLKVTNSEWRNGESDPRKDFSLITLHGTEIRSGKRARGIGANLVIIDEAQEMEDLPHLLQHIIGWQILKKKRALVLILFTSKIGHHPLKDTYIPEAIRDDRYWQCKLSEDEDFTEEEIKAVEKVVGPRGSLAFRSEGECDWQIGDPGGLVLPEWNYYRQQCEDNGKPFDLIYEGQWEMPDYYFPITTIDWAYVNFTSALFQLWDPEKKLWVILRELWMRGGTTPQKKDRILQMEREIFGRSKHSVMRWGDLTPQTQADLQQLFNFQILTADKSDAEATISGLNAMVAAGEIRIHRSCRALLHQVEYGTYDRKDYRVHNYNRYVKDLSHRTDNLMGDCDALDALRYGWKIIRNYKMENPNPPQGTYVGDQFIPDEEEEAEGLGPIVEEVSIQL